MKVSCYAQVFLIGLFLGLLCLQVPCLANDSSANSAGSNNRLLQSIPTHYYSLGDQTTDEDGTRHIFAEYKGNHDKIGNSDIVKNIEMVVSFHDKNTFRVKILNKDAQRWEIPERAPFPHFESNNSKIKEADSCCEIIAEKDPFFSFYIKRRDTGEIIFDTRNKEFVFSNYYIQLSTSLPTQYVYGFGERNYKFKLEPGIYTIWGRDDAMIVEDGSGGGNTYSHHPVGLARDSHRDFFLTLMRNSNAMDVIIENNNNQPSLTYKMVGGVIDLIFFVGDQYPETVLKGYHSYLGKFTMMPFWSMGYHQSKWGYENVHIMNDIVSKYSENGLPLDVIWSDIDYMINKEIFTVDTANFPPDQMKEMIRSKNKRWVPIIDPGVRRDSDQGPGKKEGQARNVFLKTYQGQDLVGYVWPGPCYFPDFFNPDAEKYWHDMLEILYNTIPFSGIWLDMNEIATFSNGEHGTPRQDTDLDKIPYTPGKHPLKHKTISMDAVHHGNIQEYNVHGLFSLMENAVTHKYLQSKSKLPFILTRGTSMGVGKYATHWSGDNGAHWNFLQDSIPGNFNFQIFGIPFVGADICGFMDHTNEELCARWTQVGALYPFARNHHEEKTRNQEPWTFTETNRGVTVLETTRASLKTRYAILKWYYSLFIETQGAGSIFRPLMFEFPQEDELYKDGIGDHQFLLGRSVLCTPKVKAAEPGEGEPVVDAYFPKATWYELFTGHKILDKSTVERTRKVAAPFNSSAPLFLRGGHIVHRQNVDKVLSTEDLNNEFELIVALDRETDQGALSAKGTIMGIAKYDDDSVYYRCMEGNNCLYDISVTVSKEDVASVSVEIHVKRQEQNVKISLDGFSLYGLKLYGLPLDFMEEDESKVGYGLVQIEREGQSTVTISDLVELIEIGPNAFEIVFETTLDIVDGDVIKLELLI